MIPKPNKPISQSGFGDHRKLAESRLQLNRAYQTYMEHVQPVTAPLALISQIQRSGGSMLSQLFDGHPEVHAHPHELKIGYPKKYNWPEIIYGGRDKRDVLNDYTQFIASGGQNRIMS